LQPAEAPAVTTARRGTVTLHVHDERTCVTAEVLVDRLDRERPSAREVPVEIEVSGIEQRVRFVITTSSGSATRDFVFADESCETRLRVLALALALALEALVVDEAPVEPPAAPSGPVHPPIPAPVPPVRAPASETPRSRGPTWSLAIAPVVAFGTLAIPSAGAEIQPRLSGRRWSVRLAVATVVSPAIRLGVGSFRSVSPTITPDACGLLPAGTAALRLCAGVQLGLVVASGRGYAEPRRALTPHVAPALAIEVAAPIASRVALVVGAGMAVPVVRTRFVADDVSVSGWPVTARLTAGIAVDLARRRGGRSR
jgi:hypothetical protein